MKRRIFGIGLMVWVALASLISYIPSISTPGAQAANYTFTNATTINDGLTNYTGGPTTFNGPSTPCGSPRFPSGVASTSIVVGAKITGGAGGYNAKIIVSGCGNSTNNITVSDPNGVGPGKGNKPAPAPPAGGGTTADTTPPPDCDAGAFTWAICPIIHSLTDIADWIRDSVLIPFLKEPPLTQQSNAAAYNTWAAMRNVASIFFILIFFLIIIGTAAGFDNYTVKKVLPHLIAGAILIPFSWYICAVTIDIGNILGQGLVALLSGGNPPLIPDPAIDLKPIGVVFFGAGGVMAVGLAYAAFTTIGLAAIISIVLALLAAFVTLILRKILILLFVILSPFALLAWVLPNTEKWFKRWWSNFFKLVMLYPYMMLFIEAGRLAAATAGTAFGAQINLFQVPLHVAAIGFGISPMFASIGNDALVATGHIVQLLCLWLPPGVAIFMAPKMMGEAGNFANGLVKRGQTAADNRYGKNSDFAKKLEEGRMRKNVEAAKKAETAAKEAGTAAAGQTGIKRLGSQARQLGLNRKASMNWSRAGLGTSLPGAMTGSDKLRRSQATGKAAEELGTIDAEARQSKEGDPENFANRRKSTAQSILNRKSDERGARQGVLDAHNAAGAPQATADRQRGARIDARNSELGAMGGAQGKVEDDDLNERERRAGSRQYVSPQMQVKSARDVGALQAAGSRGTARGIYQGTMAAEQQIEQDLRAKGLITGATSAAAAAQMIRSTRLRNVSTTSSDSTSAQQVIDQANANSSVATNAELDQLTSGGTMSLSAARQLRLANIGASAASHTREHMGVAEGEINAHEDFEHTVGRESIENLVTGTHLATRDSLAAARQQRTTRVAAQGNGTGAGYMSTGEVFEAAGIEAENRLAATIGTQKQAITQARVDRAIARRDGNPYAAPTMENKVIAGIEAAKASGASASASRIAAVSAVADGTAASTLEHTDAAVYSTERATALANTTIKGVAGTVNSQINARAADRQRAAAAKGVSLSPARARAEASEDIRSENLNAITQVGRANAEAQTATEINTDLGNNDTLNQEIDAEAASINENLTNSGITPMSAADARSQAQANVRARNIRAAGATARSQAGAQYSADRQTLVGTENALKSQIDEERDRLADLKLPTSDAEANVRATNIRTAGIQAAGKAAHDTRTSIDTAIGVENDNLDELAAIEATLTATGMSAVSARAQAKNQLLATSLRAAGAMARSKSERAERAVRRAEAGIERDLNAQADEAQAAAAATGGKLTRADAIAQVRKETLSAIGDSAEEKAATANREESQSAVGDQIGLNTQIAEEAAVLEKEQGLTPDQAKKQATTTVKNRNVHAAGTAARQTAISNFRKTNDANIATEKELNTSIDAEIAASGASLTNAAARTNAEAKVIGSRAAATGATAASAAVRAARKVAATEAGVLDDVEKVIKEGTDKGLSRADAEKAMLARELGAIGNETARLASEDNRTEPESAINANKAYSAQIEERAQSDLKADKTGKLTRAQARKSAAKAIAADNRADAIIAAGETGRKRQIQRVQTNTQIARDRQATLDQAVIESERRRASNEEYEKTNAGAQAAYDKRLEELTDTNPDGTLVHDEWDNYKDPSDPTKKEKYTPDEAKAEADKAKNKVTENAREDAKAAGEKARLKAEADLKAGLITTAQKEQAAYQTAAAGARETARVSLANEQGMINARAQAAFNPNALSEADRQIAATENSVASVAEELAVARANFQERAPGRAQNRTFLEAEANRSDQQVDVIQEQAIAQERVGNFSYRKRDEKTGKEYGPIITERIQEMAMSNDATEAARDEIIKLLKPAKGEPQIAKAAALARQLGTVGRGQNDLRYIQKEVFGGHQWKRTVDPDTFNGKGAQIWAKLVQGISASSAPDLFLPGVAIHDGVDAKTMAGWNWRSLQDYITDVTEKAPPEARLQLINEATDAMTEWMTSDQLKGSIDADKRRAIYGFLHPPIVDKTGFHREGNEVAVRKVDYFDKVAGKTEKKDIMSIITDKDKVDPKEAKKRKDAFDQLIKEVQPLL